MFVVASNIKSKRAMKPVKLDGQDETIKRGASGYHRFAAHYHYPNPYLFSYHPLFLTTLNIRYW